MKSGYINKHTHKEPLCLNNRKGFLKCMELSQIQILRRVDLLNIPLGLAELFPRLESETSRTVDR